MINELSAEGQMIDANDLWLKLKVGRFLTPLSPINTNFYAPVNVGISLPMMISHHELFPINLDGIVLSGGTGESFKVKCDAFAGGFRNSLLISTGPLGFFGNEDTYLLKTNGITSNFSLDSLNAKLSFGGGSHIGFAYNDLVEVGINYFTHVKGKINLSIPHPVYGNLPDAINLRREAYGINFKISYKGIRLSGEQWWCNVKITDGKYVSDTSAMSSGGYYELTYTAGKFTPYVKFESHNVDLFRFFNIEYNKYCAGINFKSSFESTLKLEYVHYDYEKPVDGALLTFIYSF